MRVWLGGAAVVAVVVGGAWLVLAFFFGHLRAGETAYVRSAACVHADRALAADPADAARYRSSGLRTLGIRWHEIRAVALFADSLSPDAVDREDARIAATGRGQLLHEDNLSLYYPAGIPSTAAQKAIGRCVYLVHYNRIASALGIYIHPHARRPFLPGARRDDENH